MSFDQPSSAFGDILSKYPITASRFSSLSRLHETVSEKGICELTISKDEVTPLFDEDGLKAYFYSEESDSYNFMAFMILNLPYFFGNGSVLFQYTSTDPIPGHDNNHRISTNETAQLDNMTASSEETINHIERMMDSNIDVYFDVITIYNVYSNRSKCQRIIPNYAHIKTREYFNSIVSLFNVSDKIIHLHLYLIVNAIILRITMPSEFTLPESIHIDDYEEYVNDTESTRNLLYNKILDKINTL